MNEHPAPHRGPVADQDRIETLDIVRGLAVLGILLINIWAFALPFPGSLNPWLVSFDTPVDRAVYAVVHMFAYTKFMPLFSMLFGAGIVLFAERVQARGERPARWFVRRQLWLLVFGLLHAYLLWEGDILVPYAVIGLLVYRLRNLRIRTLLLLAFVVFAIPKGTAQLAGHFMGQIEEQAAAAELAREAGEPLTEEQEKALEMTEESGPQWDLSPEELEEIVAIRRGGYWENVAHSAEQVLGMQLMAFPFLIGWNVIGFMLVGMVLYRTGILSGRRHPRTYARLAVACYGIGIPLGVVGLWFHFTSGSDFGRVLTRGSPIVDVSGPLIALGHMSLLILAWHRGWMPSVSRRLAAVGRMAFTNYIAHSAICTPIFYGFGLGLFGAFGRLELLGFVAGIWALQLWWSPWWLRRFRFGPLEWAWRSLTYAERQPFRR